MQNVSINEMEFLITQFNLHNGVNKNIRELIHFLKEYNKDVNESKERMEVYKMWMKYRMLLIILII